MKLNNYEERIAVPEGITVTVNNNNVVVKGEKGELQRSFVNPRVVISSEGNEIVFKVKEFTKREKMNLGTFKSHIKNMMYGVKSGFTYKLKICSGHFPMNVSVGNGQLTVKNFIGEKVPRVLDINNNVKVNINGEEIVVEGIDRELVGLTAGRIERLTKRPNFDRRIFQQGIFITEKGKREN